MTRGKSYYDISGVNYNFKKLYTHFLQIYAWTDLQHKILQLV